MSVRDPVSSLGARTPLEPEQLTRADARLNFPPSYVIVGAYRLLSDPKLFTPAWDKCRHGTRRGLIVGAVWSVLSFGLQRSFVNVFLSKSPRVIGLSDDKILGYSMPISVHTYATLLLLADQCHSILFFFLARNIRVARDRAWSQTVESRGKGPEFWKPYVEEYAVPPSIVPQGTLTDRIGATLGRGIALFVVKKAIFFWFSLYPFVGIIVVAALKSLDTAKYLHKQYFAAKKMSSSQVSLFIQERKWSYRLFGFAAALLESLPIVGLVFTISNRVGAAMWAHDLEKHQHAVAEKRVPLVQPDKL